MLMPADSLRMPVTGTQGFDLKGTRGRDMLDCLFCHAPTDSTYVAERPLRVLVVEEHAEQCGNVVAALACNGYLAQGVDSAEAVYELPTGSHFDIALVSLDLSGEGGLSLVARLRAAQPALGIVALGAQQALEDKLAGYRQGADLYLATPVATVELCAVVDALARRLAPERIPAQEDGFILELIGGRLLTPKGVLKLGYLEVELLYALALAPEGFMERWLLLERLGKSLDIYGKAQLEVLISRLRSKLRTELPECNPIRAERGQGYRLNIPLKVR